MAAETITRAQLLLQYYAALSELEAEARAKESARAEMCFHGALPMLLQERAAAQASAA